MLIRRYHPGEEQILWELFFATVRTINLGDYTQEQVTVWAPEEIDKLHWQQRIQDMNPFVCVHEDQIIGYAGLLESGYVDHFYAHKDWQGQGVGKLLYGALEAEARAQQLSELTSDVSLTARPFFESRGFHVARKQEVVRDGVILHNFRMAKRIGAVN